MWFDILNFHRHNRIINLYVSGNSAVMKLNIHKVQDNKQIIVIAALAKEIWQEAFTPIIGSS